MKDKKTIKEEFRNNSAIEQCAVHFGVVGDPTRMKICWLLCKHPELSVGEIAELLGASVSVVSHSLKRLKNHDLVETRRDHKQIFYRLADTDFNKIIKRSLPKI